jgi:hypothetical protein
MLLGQLSSHVLEGVGATRWQVILCEINGLIYLFCLIQRDELLNINILFRLGGPTQDAQQDERLLEMNPRRIKLLLCQA